MIYGRVSIILFQPVQEILVEKGVRLDGLLNIARINSVSYETSNFAQHILVVYAFMFYCIKKRFQYFHSFMIRVYF